jgi:hypothetical protein
VSGRPSVAPALIAVAVVLTIGACAVPSTSPSPSRLPTPSPAPAAGSLPSGCEPIQLVDPAGARVDLSGEWTGTSWFSGASESERTFILQLGDCVWITVTDARYQADPVQGGSILAVFHGRIESDFSIDGTLVTILRDAQVGGFSDQQVFAATALLVQFGDDGAILLREDREPGVVGPRCTQPPSACPPPVLLHRAEVE